MHHLNRLCFILPVDHDEIDPPIVSTVRSSQKRNRHRLRRWIAAFIHRLKLKWIESCRYPHRDDTAIYSQQFKDTDGIFLTQARISCRTPRIFSYAELYIGSKGFSEEEVLGSGGFGRVFRAVLPSDGTVVAVKCVAGKGDRMEKSFLAELAAVAQLRHRNLVRLRGWCVHEGQLLLVYDYMLNRSLDRILFRGPNTASRPLDWGRRRKIICGLAAALFYLHEQLDTQIIHRDVKSSNVMLDSEFNARLGDFGLARWLEHDLEPLPLTPRSLPSMNSNQRFRIAETSMIGGTIGYLPPESFTRKGFATAKSDVFSFGIVVLEVVSGRRAVDLTYPDDQIVLVDWVRALSDERKLLDASDSRLIDGSYALSDVRLLIHLGLLCSLHDPQSRPSMKWVMEVLSCNSFSGELPALPSFASQPRYISMSSSSPSATTTMATVTTTITAYSSDYETANGSTMFITAEDNSSGSTEHHQKCRNAFPSVDAPYEIPYKEILVATNNFSESQMVAEMDFGTAYHGYLEDGLHIIVKRLGMKTCPALRARFSDELRNLGSLHHRHLVQLRGWCTEQGEMLVVYDYVPHRSLGHLLSDDHNQNHILRWARRYNIVKSLASAILYLHEEWEEQVIHRSITTSSIFLDEDMNPRLGSFALAEFLTRNADGHHVANSNTTARGIFGYMSPEYMETGMATTMADVYSFGVVIMEVVSGRKAVDFRWPKVLLVQKIRELEARKRSLMELVDWRLDGDYDQKELLRLVRIGLACTRSDPNQRPTMRQIVSVLDGKDNCLYPTITERLREENREDWEERNASSLSLIRRIQALGIQ